MELALPDSVFRTYMDVDTREFRTEFYTIAPMKSFMPPQEWHIDRHDFRRMISLDEGTFYDTELSARPASYVVVPAEMEEVELRKSGLGMFIFLNDPSYPCYPARSTILSQVRVMNVDIPACLVYMPIPNCCPLVPLTTLFHQTYLVVRFGHHLRDQNSTLTLSWF